MPFLCSRDTHSVRLQPSVTTCRVAMLPRKSTVSGAIEHGSRCDAPEWKSLPHHLQKQILLCAAMGTLEVVVAAAAPSPANVDVSGSLCLSRFSPFGEGLRKSSSRRRL